MNIRIALACLVLIWSLATAQSEAPRYNEVSRKVLNRGGHTETLVRITPPMLPKASLLVAPPEPTEEEKAAAVRRASKTYETITVSANVYVGRRTYTELTWTEDDETYHALSNVDFRLLSQLTDVETKDAVFLWFPFVSAVDAEPPEAYAPTLKLLNSKQADYVLVDSTKGGKNNAKGLDLLDYLHAYAELNGPRLKTEMTRRELDEIAAEELRKKTPPPSPTIYYWLETSTRK